MMRRRQFMTRLTAIAASIPLAKLAGSQVTPEVPFAPGQTDPAENGRGNHDQLEPLDTRVEIAGPRL